jgi:hypothetical protein
MAATTNLLRGVLFTATLTTLGLVAAASPAAATRSAKTALSRIGVIGASVSDGFLLPLEVDAMVTLADTLQAAIAEPVSAPVRRSSSMFFRNPIGHGERFVEALSREQPSLVVGIDFLFWFAYGFGYSEPERIALFETGLDLLRRLDGWLVIGDLPDMSRATRGVGITGRPMITALHVPAPETLARLNARLREFAAERGRVAIVPLAEFVARVNRNEPLEIRGARFEGDLVARLLDRDLLHTTFEGQIALTMLIADSMAKSVAGLEAEDFVFDAAKIRRRVLDARAVEIAQRRRR